LSFDVVDAHTATAPAEGLCRQLVAGDQRRAGRQAEPVAVPPEPMKPARQPSAESIAPSPFGMRDLEPADLRPGQAERPGVEHLGEKLGAEAQPQRR
jgi:hypothetical protein